MAALVGRTMQQHLAGRKAAATLGAARGLLVAAGSTTSFLRRGAAGQQQAAAQQPLQEGELRLQHQRVAGSCTIKLPFLRIAHCLLAKP
jgi:hypothetical protein